METFVATKYAEQKGDKMEIELTSSDQLKTLYGVIDKQEVFLLEWTEGNVIESILMIGNNLKSKIRTGDLKLSAKRKEE